MEETNERVEGSKGGTMQPEVHKFSDAIEVPNEIVHLSASSKSEETPRWIDQNREEEETEVEVIIKPLNLDLNKQMSCKESNSEGPSIASQLDNLDPQEIYWNEDKEIYVQSSGCTLIPRKRYISH